MERLLGDDYKNCFLIEFAPENSFKLIRKVSEKEVTEIIKGNFGLHELVYYDRRIEEMYGNYYDLIKTIEDYSTKIRDLDVLGIPDLLSEEMFVNVNRTFINFISSMVNFVDHIEEKRYKKVGEKNKQFKRIVTTVYDSFISYRLFYSLRNYSLHYNFPIDVFTKNSVLKNNGVGYVYDLEIYFDRNKILKGNFFKGVLRKELEKFNHKFPVRFYMDEILKPLNIIINGFFEIEKGCLEEHSNKIMQLAREATDIYKVAIGKESNTLAKWDTIILPVKIIERLNQRIEVSQKHLS